MTATPTRGLSPCTVIYSMRHGARFRQKFTLEDAIGSHACSLEANTRVTNGISLGSSLFIPVDTLNCVQTLKVGTLVYTLCSLGGVRPALRAAKAIGKEGVLAAVYGALPSLTAYSP
jgi:hypothetical protein